MSLTKLLKAPIKLFRKEVITFVIIRRYDIGVLEDKLRYIAVRPSASISVLRQKVWHLLDLPDFCEEIIVLKSRGDVIIPIVELRKGNDPHNPYILEVWLPGNRKQSSTTVYNHNMLTIGNGDEQPQNSNRVQATTTIYEGVRQNNADKICGSNCFSQSTLSNETVALNKLHVPENKTPPNTMLFEFKKSDIMSGISSTSLFRLHSRKSHENFTTILLKIQSDLSTLSNKLSILETKLPS